MFHARARSDRHRSKTAENDVWGLCESTSPHALINVARLNDSDNAASEIIDLGRELPGADPPG